MSIEDGFKIKSVGIANLTEDFPGAHAWNVTVTNPRGRTLTHKYYKGSAYNGAEPEVMEFMSSLVMDASCVANGEDVDEFAENLGYDMDTPEEIRKAGKVFKACVKIAARLETYLTEEEREFFADY